MSFATPFDETSQTQFFLRVNGIALIFLQNYWATLFRTSWTYKISLNKEKWCFHIYFWLHLANSQKTNNLFNWHSAHISSLNQNHSTFSSIFKDFKTFQYWHHRFNFEGTFLNFFELSCKNGVFEILQIFWDFKLYQIFHLSPKYFLYSTRTSSVQTKLSLLSCIFGLILQEVGKYENLWAYI